MALVSFAYLYISIAGTDITVEPKYLESFTYERKATESEELAGNSFSFVVYDHTAVTLESLIQAGNTDVVFGYGVSKNSSKWYKAQIVSYSTTLTNYGAKLQVSGFSTNIARGNAGTSDTFLGAPSAVMAEIATKGGWKVGKIEPSIEHYTFSGNNDRTLKLYAMNGLQRADFLSHVVGKSPRSKLTGKCGYYTYFDDEKGTYNCHTLGYVKDSKNSYEFVLGAEINGKDQVIKSWTPSYNGTALLSVSGVRLIWYDAEGAQHEVKYPSNASSAICREANVDTEAEALALAETDYVHRVHQVYKGSLTLINTPHIQVMSSIGITAITNSGRHHSSGNYIVLSVTDTIRGGLITSNLSVINKYEDI